MNSDLADERSARLASFMHVRRADIGPRCTSATAIRRAVLALER